jgi:uncharacterized protein YfaP (DUF2135 family)
VKARAGETSGNYFRPAGSRGYDHVNTDNTDVISRLSLRARSVITATVDEDRRALTQDVTQGYGPEMYTLTGGPAGKFTVRAHYFASDRTG